MIEKNIPVNEIVTGRVEMSDPPLSNLPKAGKIEPKEVQPIIPDNVPNIQEIDVYRTVYLLCDINKDKRLRAIYYACVLSGGRSPTWGLFSVKTGKLMRFYGSRKQIEDDNPKKAWRVRAASWQLNRVSREEIDYAQRLKHPGSGEMSFKMAEIELSEPCISKEARNGTLPRTSETLALY